MEFTRPMDRHLDSVRKADEQKEVKYSRLRQTLGRTLQPGWKVQIATFSVGVVGTMARDNWKERKAYFSEITKETRVSVTFGVGRDDGLGCRSNPLEVTLYEGL